MSQQLDDLLFTIRQSPAFKELLEAVGRPEAADYSPSREPIGQLTDHIFRSGRRRQHTAWLQFLIGEPTSADKEKS